MQKLFPLRKLLMNPTIVKWAVKKFITMFVIHLHPTAKRMLTIAQVLNIGKHILHI
jgi:hypothetical protein